MREWVNQNGPVQNLRADAPEMGGPAQPEDFVPEVMRARWRRRQRLEEVIDAVRRNRRRPPFRARNRPQLANDIPNDVAVIQGVAQGVGLEGRPRGDDEGWTDEERDDIMAPLLGGGAQDRRSDSGDAEDGHDAAADESGIDEASNVAVVGGMDMEAMREARNRYFAVADHNRDFADHAPIPDAGPSNIPQQPPEPPFRFDFDLPDIDVAEGQFVNADDNASTSAVHLQSPSLHDLQQMDQSGQPAPDRLDPAFTGWEELPPPPAMLPRAPVLEEQHGVIDPDAGEDLVQGPEDRGDDPWDDDLEGEGFILEGDIDGIMEGMCRYRSESWYMLFINRLAYDSRGLARTSACASAKRFYRHCGLDCSNYAVRARPLCNRKDGSSSSWSLLC